MSLSLLQQGNETMADRLLVLVPHEHTHAPRSILEQARKLGPDVTELRAIKHTMELIAHSLSIANGAPAMLDTPMLALGTSGQAKCVSPCRLLPTSREWLLLHDGYALGSAAAKLFTCLSSKFGIRLCLIITLQTCKAAPAAKMTMSRCPVAKLNHGKKVPQKRERLGTALMHVYTRAALLWQLKTEQGHTSAFGLRSA